MRSFDTWNYEQVEDTFGIQPVETTPRFEEWLLAEGEIIDEFELKLLDKYRRLLLKEVQNWNEDELKLFFIGPVLALVDFNTEHFKSFTQRTLTVEKGEVSASGKVDFMLAKGKVLPKLPYFCLHEYKQENRRDNDPLGQLLIAMVAAQYKNPNPEMPIYGSYVSGRNWFFVLLEGKKYVVTDAYVSTSEDLYRVFNILRRCKRNINVLAK